MKRFLDMSAAALGVGGLWVAIEFGTRPTAELGMVAFGLCIIGLAVIIAYFSDRLPS